MSQNIGCFGNIIGLSRTTCNCIPQGPDGYNVSTSGLYMDELAGMYLDMVNAAKDCSKGNLWDLMALAREEAIGFFKADLKSCLTSNTLPQLPYFSGTVGDAPNLTPESQTGKTFAGQAWALRNSRGATLKIKRIGAAFKSTTSGSIVLKIYDDLDSSPLYIIPLDTQANSLKWNSSPGIEIPLSIIEKKYKTLYFVYAVDPAIIPMQMNVTCGCGSLGTVNLWNTESPIWRMTPEPNSRYEWLNWMLVTGINTTAPALSSAVTFSTQQLLSGILFDIEITCDIDDVICKDTFATVDPAISMVMAHAIRYKADSLLITSILSSPNLSRFTTKDREYNEEKRLEYLDEYDKRMSGYLCPTLSRPPYLNKYNDCLKCRDKFSITSGKILR